MRRILVSYARQHNADKRYGQVQRLALDEDLLASSTLSDSEAIQLVALDEALDRLAEFNERGCRVVQYRVFAGLTHDEIAELLSISVVSVRRAWSLAKMWAQNAARRGYHAVKMSPERWQKIESLYDAYLACPQATRGEFLERTGANDPELLSIFEYMLAVGASDPGFLESPFSRRGASRSG